MMPSRSMAARRSRYLQLASPSPGVPSHDRCSRLGTRTPLRRVITPSSWQKKTLRAAGGRERRSRSSNSEGPCLLPRLVVQIVEPQCGSKTATPAIRVRRLSGAAGWRSSRDHRALANSRLCVRRVSPERCRPCPRVRCTLPVPTSVRRDDRPHTPTRPHREACRQGLSHATC